MPFSSYYRECVIKHYYINLIRNKADNFIKKSAITTRNEQGFYQNELWNENDKMPSDYVKNIFFLLISFNLPIIFD